MEDSGKEYYKISQQVSLEVNKYIIKKIKSKKLPENLEKFMLKLPTKRKDNSIMRSSLTYIIYKNLGGNKKINELLSILSISELSNYFSYLDNWILDNKNNCNKDFETIKKITIASEIFRELCQECIEESDLTNQLKRQISEKIFDTSIKLYKGQMQDIELTIDKINSFKTDEDFFKYYEEKSKLCSGYWYGLSFELGALILNKNNTKLINQLGNKFGTSLHISNDLGDFGLFYIKSDSFKEYQDQLADLINKRLTLPIYLTLKYGNENEINALLKVIKKPKDEKLKINASKAIFTSGSFHRILVILKKYENEITSEIKTVLPDNKYRNMIESVLSIITTNKYLKDLKLIKKPIFQNSNKSLILVDEKDNIIGHSKSEIVHNQIKLHRAVSVLIFNSKNEILLQKINSIKPNIGGLWAGTCKTHQYKDEKSIDAAKRKLKINMKINTKLKKISKLKYKLQTNGKIIEHEINQIYVGQYNLNPEINTKEIEDYKWININKLKKDINENSKKYIWWLKIVINEIN
jgi:isopentenyl-diphosphate delta-isomerase